MLSQPIRDLKSVRPERIMDSMTIINTMIPPTILNFQAALITSLTMIHKTAISSIRFKILSFPKEETGATH